LGDLPCLADLLNAMITAENHPYRIHCETVWGGIEPVGIDLSTKGVIVSLHSTASGGEHGGDIYYLSVCPNDLLTYMVVADVRGHGEQVSDISSWIYKDLQERMNSLDAAGLLSGLNRMVHSRGSVAITTAAVVCHDSSNSTLYYSYAGHPPVLARRSGGRWLPLVLGTQSGRANLPLGVLHSVRYDQGEARVEAGDRFLLYTDGLSEAMSAESDEEFGETELLALLEAQGSGDLETLKDALVERVTAFSGGSLLDDCTLMVVEVR
jgi:sigma-B regulation protein RsbU (phosphoserine phosphatase)